MWKQGSASFTWPKWPGQVASGSAQVLHLLMLLDTPIRGSRAPYSMGHGPLEVIEISSSDFDLGEFEDFLRGKRAELNASDDPGRVGGKAVFHWVSTER